MAGESQLPYRQVNICASLEMTTKWIPARHPKCSTTVESSLQIDLFMQNKAKVKIGKMSVSVAIIKDYDKKTNNQQRTLFKTKPNKANW